MSPITLTKHHGLGNDFLVLLDVDNRWGDDATGMLASRVCDRRRGVGADGLLVGRPGHPSADLRMELRNADGRRAEMSGNGIRCLVQAALNAGMVGGDAVLVATEAGDREVRVVHRHDGSRMDLAVNMGAVVVGGDVPHGASALGERRAMVDAGNPHLVLLDPRVDGVEVATEGARIEAMFIKGINVEWIRLGPGSDELTLRVWERGVGVTDACGTGSCAAAVAAHGWGLVGPRVVVHNPGGDVMVDIAEEVVLSGPTVFVAKVELPCP